jgi:hypothetical protein
MEKVITVKEMQASYTVPVDEATLGQMPVILERARMFELVDP